MYDDMFELLGVLLAIAFFLGPWVLGIVALAKIGGLRRENAELRRWAAELEIGRAAGPPAGEAPRPSAAAAPPPPETIAAAEDEPVEPPVDAPAEEPEPPGEEPPRPAVAPPVAASESLEERFTVRWAVWVGALALALGGVFLVKYSIERGWIGPTVRVVLGILLGSMLIGLGHRLRSSPLQQLAMAALKPAYVPPALVAAGVSTLYASIYAAYGLYDMIPALFAFVLLAGVSAASVGLALIHGPLIALLGLLGAFIVPALVSTDNPQAWALFPYLGAVLAGCLGVVRYRGWRWLSWVALAAATCWPLLWFVTQFGPGDAAPVGAYVLALAALYLFLVPVTAEEAPSPPADAGWDEKLYAALGAGGSAAWAAGAIAAWLAFVILRMDHYGVVSLIVAGLLGALFMFAARRDARFDLMPWLGALTALAAIALWHLPVIATWPEPIGVVEGQAAGTIAGPIVPPAFASFTGWSAAYAALFAAGGFIALWGAARPARWASLSAAFPVLVLALAYWRITDFAVSLPWGAASLALAGVLVLAAQRTAAHRSAPGMEGALAAYAIGAVAAVSVAMTTTLEHAWLTVALSLELPAMAWIYSATKVEGVRRVALAVAAVVLARLLANPFALDYPLGTTPIFNWLLYGYGIPGVAFFFAAREFRRSASDTLVAVLEAGVLAFAVYLSWLEIQHFATGGTLQSTYGSLFERSLQTLAWLGLSYGILLLRRRHARPVLDWGWRVIGGLACVHFLYWQGLVSNPMLGYESVGDWPLFNLLALAYFVPAAMGVLFFLEAARQGYARIALFAGTAALVLGFVWISYETRHAFHGDILYRGATVVAEWYAYSAVWLVYGGLLLALGIWRNHAGLRYASIAVVALTVAKVFLFDMSELTGLWRAVSFLGLGGTLVGVALLYQRFVFPPGEKAAGEGTGGEDAPA